MVDDDAPQEVGQEAPHVEVEAQPNAPQHSDAWLQYKRQGGGKADVTSYFRKTTRFITAAKLVRSEMNPRDVEIERSAIDELDRICDQFVAAIIVAEDELGERKVARGKELREAGEWIWLTLDTIPAADRDGILEEAKSKLAEWEQISRQSHVPPKFLKLEKQIAYALRRNARRWVDGGVAIHGTRDHMPLVVTWKQLGDECRADAVRLWGQRRSFLQTTLAWFTERHLLSADAAVEIAERFERLSKRHPLFQ